MAAAQLKVRIYYVINLIQKLKEFVNISNLCNFQLFASNIEENISDYKLQNCCKRKKLMSHTSRNPVLRTCEI